MDIGDALEMGGMPARRQIHSYVRLLLEILAL
jgi:hypothetical protein